MAIALLTVELLVCQLREIVGKEIPNLVRRNSKK